VLPAWPRPPEPLAPLRGQALVLAFTLVPGAERLRELRALLSADEREREARFAFPDLRDRFAAARGQLREALAAALAQDPRALRFSYGKSGKPALVAGELQFNLSHSGDVALLALSLGGELGVDVELHRERSFTDIAERFFAPGERAELRSLPEPARGPAFYDIWTAKEAFVKATGEGITVPLEDFERRWTAPGAGRIEILRGANQGRSFWLRRIDVGASASAALVGEGQALALSLAGWPAAT
jgi:4'-phosphopantetheinyl transferase